MNQASRLPSVVVTNLHRRYTGVSATVRSLVPVQRRVRAIGLLDWGSLGLPPGINPVELFRSGWTHPPPDGWRVWHARRDLEIVLGLLLRSVMGQPWRVLFTSAAPKPPGVWLRWLIKRCDGVIATSHLSASFLPVGCVTATIHHGVDTGYYIPAEGLDPTAEKILAQNSLANQYLIGCFGRIRPSKGIDLLVHALIAVLPERPSFSAIFTGLVRPAQRGYLEAMKERIHLAGLEHRIQFLGDLDRDAVRFWYQRTHLCVAASRREGFGLTPLEAMACGCAVLASGAGVWPELIDASVGGRFTTGSHESLTQALAELTRDPTQLQAMGVRARQRAVEHHSLEAEAAAIETVYGLMLSPRC